MKYFLFLIFLGPMASMAQLQGANSRLKVLGVQGRVKQLTMYFYENDRAFKEKQPKVKEVMTFDATGRELEDFKTEDNKTTKTIYRYNKRRICDTTFSNGVVSQTDLEILDTAGRLIEWDFEENKPDLPLRFRTFDSKTFFKYDQKGRQLEAASYDGDRLMSKHKFVYNDKNQLSEEDEIIYHSSENQMIKTVNSYNSSGFKIKVEGYESDKLNYIGVTSYNNFDQHGNWRTSTNDNKYYSDTMFKNSTFRSTTVREIIYFQ